MATSQSTVDFVQDQLSELPGVRVRKMFGEYALYVGDQVVALLCDDQLFVKITVPGKALVAEHYVEGFAYPGAKASMLVGAEMLEDSERLTELVRVTAAALPPPKPKSKSKPKPENAAATKRSKAQPKAPAPRRKPG